MSTQIKGIAGNGNIINTNIKNITNNNKNNIHNVTISTASYTKPINLTQSSKENITYDYTNQNKSIAKRTIDKIMPIGLGINTANAELYTVLPYKYAQTYGKDITSLSQILPDKITSAKIVNNFTSTKAGNWIAKQANNAYIEGVKGANQFYNGGSFISKGSLFGTKALSETSATIAKPQTILKTIVSIPSIAGAAGGGAIETILTTKEKYFDKGGIEEVSKHSGEIGGRFVGATAGNLIGIGAATTISAIVGGAATGAAAGTVVPVIGNVVGALSGCVIGAITSTLIGDTTAELGANLFDKVNT